MSSAPSSSKIRVAFVSGPLNHGDLKSNIERAEEAGARLARDGVTPIIPHSMFRGSAFEEFGYEKFMSMCFDYIERCDSIYMLKGWDKSLGSLQELKFAMSIGLEVIYERAIDEN